MSEAQVLRLSDGTSMPRIGLGVYRMNDVATCEATVSQAIGRGYRLIDTAAVYRNERAVGRGIRGSGIPRDEIVVTTKLWPADLGRRRSPAAIARSLDLLDVGRIDVMLLHRPHGDIVGAWRAMEDAVDRGLVRSIGVSNFDRRDLVRLLGIARIRPVVDQIELHPYWQQPELLPFLADEGIVPQAWYPLGHGSRDLLADPTLMAIAARHSVSVVQVILRWHVQRGVVPLPKTTNPAHLAANLDVFRTHLAAEEMAAIDALGRSRPLYRMPRWLDAVTTRLGTPPALP